MVVVLRLIYWLVSVLSYYIQFGYLCAVVTIHFDSRVSLALCSILYVSYSFSWLLQLPKELHQKCLFQFGFSYFLNLLTSGFFCIFCMCDSNNWSYMFYISSRSAAVFFCKYIRMDSSSLADRWRIHEMLSFYRILSLFFFFFSIISIFDNSTSLKTQYNCSRTRHWFSSFAILDCDNIFRI